MNLIKAVLLHLFTFYFSAVAFAQRVTQEDIYGEYGGGDAGFLGYLALLVFAGLIVWGVITDRGFRLGVIGYVTYLGSIIFILKVFGKEWGIIACVISIVILLINDPAFEKKKDSKAETKANDLNENKSDHLKPLQDEPKSKYVTSFDNSSYPVPEIKTTSNNQTSKSANQTKAKEKSDDELIQGNIKCCDCGYQDAPRNFLASDVGELYRKCPKCNMSWQVLTPPSNFGNYRCSGCGLEGDKGAFFPSSAGKDYLCCVKCNTHFQRNY
jgi:hypothetical protein